MLLTSEAARGRGGVLVLEGPAGIGKTALVGLAGELAHDAGLQRLRATGSELEAGFPFGVARQLLEGSLDRLTAASAPRPSPGPPDWPTGSSAPARGSASEPTELHSAIHALFRLTMNLARDRPALITVDDAHWSRPDLPAVSPLSRTPGRRWPDRPAGGHSPRAGAARLRPAAGAA